MTSWVRTTAAIEAYSSMEPRNGGAYHQNCRPWRRSEPHGFFNARRLSSDHLALYTTYALAVQMKRRDIQAHGDSATECVLFLKQSERYRRTSKPVLERSHPVPAHLVQDFQEFNL
jgi:hypothetical protein